ncbi:hypothetical protein SAMN05428939_7849 [Streptomyces sp. TLI_105]|nr:hypothetical protein SAMN05428939_7849 [Streptomyces sp. TLI_105]
MPEPVLMDKATPRSCRGEGLEVPVLRGRDGASGAPGGSRAVPSGGCRVSGLRVWPTVDVLAVFRFHADDEVDFDVDLRELQGQERLDVFCGFLQEIGRRLGKPVLMDPEGDYGHPVLGFDVEADRVVLLADPQVR